MEFTSPDLQLRLLDPYQKDPVMQPLDLAPPSPTLAAWSRTARPVRIGHRCHALESREGGPIRSDIRSHMPPWAVRLDDILFGFAAITLILVPLVVLPLAAWLR